MLIDLELTIYSRTHLKARSAAGFTAHAVSRHTDFYITCETQSQRDNLKFPSRNSKLRAFSLFFPGWRSGIMNYDL